MARQFMVLHLCDSPDTLRAIISSLQRICFSEIVPKQAKVRSTDRAARYLTLTLMNIFKSQSPLSQFRYPVSSIQYNPRSWKERLSGSNCHHGWLGSLEVPSACYGNRILTFWLKSPGFWARISKETGLDSGGHGGFTIHRAKLLQSAKISCGARLQAPGVRVRAVQSRD